MPNPDALLPFRLPPAFQLAFAPPGEAAFATACAMASRTGAGTMVVGRRPDLVDLALVLEPDEPLRSARQVFCLGMVALVDAVGAVAPPEMPLTIRWPDTLIFDGARLGGGQLGWPDGAHDDQIPDWLVFGATLIGSKRLAGDPGLTPGSTSLEEEGFGPEDGGLIIEGFARFMLRLVDGDGQGGRRSALDAYCARLTERGPGHCPTLDGAGDLRLSPDEPPRSLTASLAQPAWLDSDTGMPRL